MSSILRSFRVRITLLSTALSGLVLLAFGYASWDIAKRMSQERFDASIRELANPYLAFPRPRGYWDEMAESLTFLLGQKQDDAFVLMVAGHEGELLYQSSNWPAGLDPGALPPPLDGPRPGPAPDGDRRHEGPRGPGMHPPPPPRPDGPYPGGPPPRGQRGAHRGEEHEDGRIDARAVFAQAPGGGDFDPRRGPGPGPGRGRSPGRPGPPPSLPVETRSFHTITTPDLTWRVGVLSNPEVTVALGLDLAPVNAQLQGLRNTYLIATPIALLLIAAGGWAVSRRALKPVQTLTATAERVTVKGLDQRIPAGHVDAEFENLIAVFNAMMERLDRSFRQATRFSADAAHELKTPLTILQGQLENALAGAETGSPQQQTYNGLLEEVQRLKSIIRKLLLLSMADAGQLTINPQPVRISELVAAVCEDVEIMAPKLTLQEDVAPGLVVQGDADLIKQVVQNLVTNAVKYNRKGGTIDVQLKQEQNHIVLSIANTGKGIPEEDRDRIFDRFYRGDKARGRKGGVGLGLSLGREIARAHGGDLVLAETQEDRTVFQLALPGTPG